MDGKVMQSIHLLLSNISSLLEVKKKKKKSEEVKCQSVLHSPAVLTNHLCEVHGTVLQCKVCVVVKCNHRCVEKGTSLGRVYLQPLSLHVLTCLLPSPLWLHALSSSFSSSCLSLCVRVCSSMDIRLPPWTAYVSKP